MTSSSKDAQKIGLCIKETGNWSKIRPSHKFDNKEFSGEQINADISVSAPKLKALIDKIHELDAIDMEKEGRMYKHFIYSDIKSSYGAKLIASALYASGFEHAYHVAKTSKGMSFQLKDDLLNQKTGGVFATLTSVSFFEKPIGINFRKELLKVFNSRPDNIYGEKIRIIILDSGFREGVDLFDVKYAHIFEPIITVADEKQAIGRVTRYCGQKGLEFHPSEGWPVQVFKYETILPKAIRKILHVQYPDLAPSESFFEMFLKFSNIDPKKLTFANELEKVSIRAAIDYELTRNIHDFKVNARVPSTSQVKGAGLGDTFKKYQDLIQSNYKKYKWPPIQIENGCTGAPIPQAIPQDELKEQVSEYFTADEGLDINTETPTQKGGALVLPFTPTQDFIRHYFTPKFEKHGILLWHSVGTGKTCTAIATASSSFERENYTTIYVTRHTLKGDVWKNMFDQVCSSILQERIAQGLELPEAQAQRMRLLGGRWIEPMSYRQFSNMLDGKSRLYEDLVKRNGKKDPLHKTLVIIDEAHKMFAPDVTGNEKPDMDVIIRAFHHSMQVSGKDGVRMLFMTATPYTSNPMDLIRILNLFRLPTDKLPEEFDDFARMYLTESGEFSNEGKLKYWDDIAGYISYLNREKDIRTFSYAIVHNVPVPLSNYEFDTMIHEISYRKFLLDTQIDNLRRAESVNEQDIQKLRTSLAKEYNELVSQNIKLHSLCIRNKTKEMHQEKLEANKMVHDSIQACNALKDRCISDLTEVYKAMVAEKKTEAKHDKKECKKDKDCIRDIDKKLQQVLEDLKYDREYGLEECKKHPILKKCIEEANETYKNTLKKIDTGLEYCNQLKKIHKDVEVKKLESNKKRLEELTTSLNELIKLDKERIQTSRNNIRALEEALARQVDNDRSQRLRLETCLNIKPAYKRLLQNDRALLDIEIESGPIINEEEAEAFSKGFDKAGISQNVYLVSGHGSETVDAFKERVTMPKDKVLIIFPVCARPNYMDIACKFINEFEKPENRALFMNPLRNRDKIMRIINQPFRIYLPGEKVPNLSTNLFLNYDKEKTIIVKSGVYRIGNIPDIDRTRFPESKNKLGSDLCSPLIGQIESPMHYNRAIHYEVFKGNLYEPVKTKDTYSNLMYKNFDLQSIMSSVGPGIYYYIGCRSTHKNVDPTMYEQVYVQSQAQQEKSGRSVRIRELSKIIRRNKDGVISPIASPPSVFTPPKEKEEEKKPEEEPELSSYDKRMKELEKQKEARKKEREQKRLADNSKEEIRELDKIMEDIQAWEERIFTVTDISWESLDQKIASWMDTLQGLKQTKRVEGIRLEIDILNDMRANKDKAKIDIGVREQKIAIGDSDKKKLFKVFYKTYVYRYKTYMRRVGAETVGIIPSGHKDATKKCTTDMMVKRIKKLLQQNKPITLPKEPSVWENSPTLFQDLCTEVRAKYRE